MKILINDLQFSKNYTIQIRSNDGTAVSEWSPKYNIYTLGKANNPAVVTGATWISSGTSWIASGMR